MRAVYQTSPTRASAPPALRRLADRLPAQPKRVWRLSSAKESAVSVVLRHHRGELSVLLVQRARREGDRWSGHIACPGGVRQVEDATLLETARRETREEIGLELGDSHLLGATDEARALIHGGRKPMRVAPFVFVASPSIDDLILGDEVDEAFWFPLDRAARGDFDGRHWHRRKGRLPLPFGAWRYDGHTIWGITYGILRALVRRIY